MNHRHLVVSSSTPVEKLPAAALHDLLERGDLDDWRPLLQAIEREPRGRVTEIVGRLIDAYPMYGTSPLFRSWIERCRHSAPRSSDPVPRMSLRSLRQSLGKTQAELAASMGISQSDYSKLERRKDVRVSTMRSVAAAVGGRLVVAIELPEGLVEIEIGGASCDRHL